MPEGDGARTVTRVTAAATALDINVSDKISAGLERNVVRGGSGRAT